MSLSESIRPSADLRSRYSEISRQCRENREAVIITVNGRGDTVSLGYEQYQQMKAKIELLEMLGEDKETDVAVIPGITAAKPHAAFYIFPKVDVKKFNIHSDEQMALDLLKQQKILVTAGTGFHWERPDHFRIVYLPDLVQLKEASDRLTRFFSGYSQK